MAHWLVARKWSYPLSTKAQSKVELRKILREACLAVDTKQRALAANAAKTVLSAHSLFQSSQTIAGYFARAIEMDLMPIMEAVWHAQKKCYLPVLAPADNTLHFVAYKEDDDLQINRHKILEPTLDIDKTIATPQLDLVLVPLMGFDDKGNRLGNGGGFYDRSFAFLHGQPRPSKPILIGVGYELQQSNAIPHEAWDVQLDGVLTEKKLLLF
jgi:5-formyltetrahydrofolate cyclo-ligase